MPSLCLKSWGMPSTAELAGLLRPKRCSAEEPVKVNLRRRRCQRGELGATYLSKVPGNCPADARSPSEAALCICWSVASSCGQRFSEASCSTVTYRSRDSKRALPFCSEPATSTFGHACACKTRVVWCRE
jgi:hypothetical protein